MKREEEEEEKCEALPSPHFPSSSPPPLSLKYVANGDWSRIEGEEKEKGGKKPSCSLLLLLFFESSPLLACLYLVSTHFATHNLGYFKISKVIGKIIKSYLCHFDKSSNFFPGS